MAFSQFMQGNKPTQRKKNIFISYREKDTAGETGRLADSLLQYFEADQVFRDIDKIEPGIDFSEAISKSLEACDVMLAVIGPDWATITHPNSTDPRLKDPNDWVRIEIASALSRNIRVVPVLVNGAVLPTSNQLPHDLQGLLRRQSYEVSNRRWQYDTENLAAFLEKSVGIPAKPRHNPNQPNPKQATGGIMNLLKYGLIGLGALFIILMIVYGVNGDSSKKDEPVVNVYDSGYNKNIINNPIPVEPRYDPPPSIDVDKSEVREKISNIDGVWDDNGGTYYIDIVQDNNRVTLSTYNVNGEKTGDGSGTLEGQHFSFKLNFYLMGGYPCIIKGVANETLINGTLSFQSNGANYNEVLLWRKRS